MRTILAILIYILCAAYGAAQQATNEALICDCPDCRESAEDGAFILPGVEELETVSQTAGPDPEEHAEHDHASHDAEDVVLEEHTPADHDTEAHTEDHEVVVELPDEMADEVGIRIKAAEGGILARHSVFPAEIKLNRDRTASVSARYASVIRQVFAEIGDEVKKGDVLASLENRETLAVYTIAAPLDGVVISKDLAVGETADSNKVLYEVADLGSVWADISIFPQYQHLITKEKPVEFIAHDGHAARGTVKYISPIISHETRTFTARCILEGAGVDFTPGAFVRARIETESAEVGVRIERTALQTIEGESVVFVPEEHGYAPVPVMTGLADGRYIEITSGLESGDPYVAAGAFALKAELITSGLDPHAGHGH